MPRFSYVVKDNSGKAYRGVLDANSKTEVISQLQTQNYFIVDIVELSTAKTFSAKSGGKRKFTHKKIKLDDLLIFSHQLSTMLESGVTLTRSLDVILSQVETQSFRPFLLFSCGLLIGAKDNEVGSLLSNYQYLPRRVLI